MGLAAFDETIAHQEIQAAACFLLNIKLRAENICCRAAARSKRKSCHAVQPRESSRFSKCLNARAIGSSALP